MENEYFENFKNTFKALSTQINDLRKKKLSLNNEIDNIIYLYEETNSLILNSLLKAREFFHRKNKEIYEEIRKLKNKKNRVEKSLKDLRNKKCKINKPESDNKLKEEIDSLKEYVEVLDYKTKDLNNIIFTRILDIEEENKIVEKIKRLEDKRIECLKLINHLKKRHISNIQNSAYFEINEKISNKREELTKLKQEIQQGRKTIKNNHKSMLELYHNAKKIKNLKENIALELLDHKFIACQFYSKFLNSHPLIDKEIQSRYINSLEKRKEILKISKRKEEIREEKKAEYNRLNSYMREKLKAALEKQKEGKKLHISELKLILDNS